MSLLELDHVSKCYGRASRVVLRDVSLQIEPGELVAIWGLRRSGRSTLLRIAAGIERPDSGRVYFEGRELAGRGADVMGEGIGYCDRELRPVEGPLVRDQITTNLLACGVSHSAARSRGRTALERVGGESLAERRADSLDGAEAVRTAIARALVCEPRLLVIDEPTLGVDLAERDDILRLLRSLADAREGLAVLAAVGQASGLCGADRALALCDGELSGATSPEQPKLANVTLLRRRAG